MRCVTPLITFALGGLLVAATLLAQDQGPPMPKPGPEHAHLKQRVGAWNAVVKIHMGSQTIEDTATMTWQMLGDFWLVGDYEGRFMGTPFQVHELCTYDDATGQFVSHTIESTGPDMNTSRGSWDEAGKVMTLTSADTDPMSGKKGVKTFEFVDEDTLKFTYGPEGAREPMMDILYTRRK